MATETLNLHLQKPSYNDPADISVINYNMDILDNAAKPMVGSNTTDNGQGGTVPFPPAGTSNRFLRCDGRWVTAGGDSGSAGLYVITATIATTDWTASGSSWVVNISDNAVTASMNVLEWYIDDEANMLGVTDVTATDNTVTITTDVKPTASWIIHIDLGTDGADVLAEVSGKADQDTLYYVETSDTCSTTGGIPKGSYLLWKESLYIVKSAISYGGTISISNLDAVTNGGLNSLSDNLTSLITKSNNRYVGVYPNGHWPGSSKFSVTVPCWNPQLNNPTISSCYAYDSSGGFFSVTGITVEAKSKASIEFLLPFNSSYAGKMLNIDYSI